MALFQKEAVISNHIKKNRNSIISRNATNIRLETTKFPQRPSTSPIDIAKRGRGKKDVEAPLSLLEDDTVAGPGSYNIPSILGQRKSVGVYPNSPCYSFCGNSTGVKLKLSKKFACVIYIVKSW